MIRFKISYSGFNVELSLDAKSKDESADYRIMVSADDVTPRDMSAKEKRTYNNVLKTVESSFLIQFRDGAGLETKIGQDADTPLDVSSRLHSMQKDGLLTYEVIEGKEVIAGGFEDDPNLLTAGIPQGQSVPEFDVPSWITEAIANG